MCEQKLVNRVQTSEGIQGQPVVPKHSVQAPGFIPTQPKATGVCALHQLKCSAQRIVWPYRTKQLAHESGLSAAQVLSQALL
jgi:hypothetical protein